MENINKAQEERLSLLLEELGEVLQILGKIKRFGMESREPLSHQPNSELLAKELADLIIASSLLVLSQDVDHSLMEGQMDSKVESLRWFLLEQENKDLMDVLKEELEDGDTPDRRRD